MRFLIDYARYSILWGMMNIRYIRNIHFDIFWLQFILSNLHVTLAVKVDFILLICLLLFLFVVFLYVIQVDIWCSVMMVLFMAL